MKKLILLILLIPSIVFGSTRALQFDVLLAGLVDADGVPLASGTVYFYAAGTSTAKNVYTDKAKTAPYTYITLDTAGRSQVYGDGNYKVLVKDSAGTTYATWDNVYVRAANYYARTVTSSATATEDDDFIMCSTNGGAITITLPDISDGLISHPLIIKRNGSNNVVIDGDGAETIDGAATYTISVDKRSVELISDGTNWQISAIPVSSMWDADGDTGIQVEESADEDIIRLDINGTERLTLQNGKLEPTTDNQTDLGSSTKEFKDGYYDGTVYMDAMNIDGTALTAAELQQLATIGTTTLSANQWAAIGGMAETLAAAELDYLDITTLGTSQNSKAVTQSAAGVVTIGAASGDQTINIASHDLVDGGLKLAGTLITASAAEINTAADGLTEPPISGDSYIGKEFRFIKLSIQDASAAAKIKCTTTDVWNASSNGPTDDITKDSTTGNYTLHADGDELTLEYAGLADEDIAHAIVSVDIMKNATAVNLHVYYDVVSSDIHLEFENESGADQDLTTLVDTGDIMLGIFYISYDLGS